MQAPTYLESLRLGWMLVWRVAGSFLAVMFLLNSLVLFLIPELMRTGPSLWAILFPAGTAALISVFVSMPLIAGSMLTKHLQSVRQAVAPVLELPRYFAGVNEKMRSIGQALLGNYKGEEAALRSRLKVLEQARKELEPVVADQGVEAMSRQ